MTGDYISSTPTPCDRCDQWFLIKNLGWFAEEQTYLCSDCQKEVGAGYCENCGEMSMNVEYRPKWDASVCMDCDDIAEEGRNG